MSGNYYDLPPADRYELRRIMERALDVKVDHDMVRKLVDALGAEAWEIFTPARARQIRAGFEELAEIRRMLVGKTSSGG